MRKILPALLLTCCAAWLSGRVTFPSDGEEAGFYREKAGLTMIKNDTLLSWMNFATDGMEMFASPEDKSVGKVEMKVYWEEVETFRQLVYDLPEDTLLKVMLAKGTGRFSPALRSKQKTSTRLNVKTSHSLPLEGLRIALDPGHTGGEESFARMEKKYIRMAAGTVPGVSGEIAFNEGNLTMATSFALADSLRKLGATVMITRNGYGLTAFGMKFNEWKDKYYALALEDYIRDRALTPEAAAKVRAKTKENEIFHSVFKHAEFEERARLIQEFHPDLILAIHYNVEESNNSNSAGYFKPQPENYCMTFVPGAWAEGELDQPAMRLEFLANLLTEDYENSVEFSALVANEFEKVLGVPLMEYDTTVKYLRDYSLPTGERGVFARNLGFNRMVHGTICFGETLFQDNLQECRALNEKKVNFHGWMGPKRAEDVANAYLKGILAWVNNQ